MGKIFQKNRLQSNEANGASLIRASGFLVLLFFLIVLVTGCVQQPLPEAASPPALLYTSKCGLCHTPFHPQTHTYTGWKNVIPRMEKNAVEQGMNHLLSEGERAVILAYLEKHARKGF